MTLFFDTSALVKFFAVEAGTPRITEWVISGRNALWISELTIVEYH